MNSLLDAGKLVWLVPNPEQQSGGFRKPVASPFAGTQRAAAHSKLAPIRQNDVFVISDKISWMNARNGAHARFFRRQRPQDMDGAMNQEQRMPFLVSTYLQVRLLDVGE
jgi:hypothetical protein